MESCRRRLFFVFGGLGVVGSEVAEQLLARGDGVVVCDFFLEEEGEEEEESDVVNGASVSEKRLALRRLSEFSPLVEFAEWKPRSAGALKTLLEAYEPSDVLLFGLCGRRDGADLAYAALAETRFSPKAAVVASSAAVYDTSLGNGRRGGSSARTHTRPLLSESDAVDDGKLEIGDENTKATWRVEHAVCRACPPGRGDAPAPKVAVLRYFGVFGGRARVDWAKGLVKRFTSTIHSQNNNNDVNNDDAEDSDLKMLDDLLGMKRLGAYGCADFCGVSDAADAAVRTVDALHNAGLPGATAVNVGVGRAHRAEHVSRAAAAAIATLGLDWKKKQQKRRAAIQQHLLENNHHHHTEEEASLDEEERNNDHPFLEQQQVETRATRASTLSIDHAPPLVTSSPPSPGGTNAHRLLASKLMSKSCPTGLSTTGGDARAGFAAADVSKLRALVGWVPASRLEAALAKELAKSLDAFGPDLVDDILAANDDDDDDDDDNYSNNNNKAERATASSNLSLEKDETKYNDDTESHDHQQDRRRPKAEEKTTASPRSTRRKNIDQANAAPPSSSHYLQHPDFERDNNHSFDDDQTPYAKNRSLAALDLSSCAATHLLQVSLVAHDIPKAEKKTPDTQDEDLNAFGATSRTNRNHRFFQLNQFTAIPARSYDANKAKPNLKNLFASVEA